MHTGRPRNCGAKLLLATMFVFSVHIFRFSFIFCLLIVGAFLDRAKAAAGLTLNVAGGVVAIEAVDRY